MDWSRHRTLPGIAKPWHHTPNNKTGFFGFREAAMMILHHGWRSSASRRVRLCLEEKGLVYEGHVVDMACSISGSAPPVIRLRELLARDLLLF